MSSTKKVKLCLFETNHFPIRKFILVCHLSYKKRCFGVMFCAAAFRPRSIAIGIAVTTAISACIVHANINTGDATALRSLIRIFYSLNMEAGKFLKNFTVNTTGMSMQVSKLRVFLRVSFMAMSSFSISQLCVVVVQCVKLHHDFVDFLRVGDDAIFLQQVVREAEGISQRLPDVLALHLYRAVDLAQQERGQVEGAIQIQERGVNHRVFLPVFIVCGFPRRSRFRSVSARGQQALVRRMGGATGVTSRAD